MAGSGRLRLSLRLADAIMRQRRIAAANTLDWRWILANFYLSSIHVLPHDRQDIRQGLVE